MKNIFLPRNENFKQSVQDSFKKQGIMETLGASLTKVEAGECEITLLYNKKLTQQHDYIHGGVISTIADSSAGYAAYTLVPSGSTVLTTEFKINLLAPAKGDLFIARAKVIKSGKTLQIVMSEVFSVENNEEKPCALLTATIMTMVNKPEKNL